jgi:ABC-2 type transport system ATP-binding protein
MLAIEIQGLRREFDGIVAVDGIDLSVEAGSFYGFLGPNGAGKSTTIKMLTGLLHPSAGTATILGHDVVHDSIEAKRAIGVVSEELSLFDRLTGIEYLTFVGRMYGLDRKMIVSRSDELLELMGLTAAPEKLVVDYSHGMKKKLALAAALIHEPKVLFLDEPFEGVDAIASSLIRDLLQRLRDRGVTIFLTSHILEIVERLCTDLAIIHQGKLVAQGPLDVLLAGVPSGQPNVSTTKTLEQIFLEATGADDEPPATLSWLR